jgi:hypothetical protein
VTALLPGATDSDFHTRTGLGETKFGDNNWMNDKRLVVRQGVDALLAGKDAVIGGSRATKFDVLRNASCPSGSKATRQAREARDVAAGPARRRRSSIDPSAQKRAGLKCVSTDVPLSASTPTQTCEAPR